MPITKEQVEKALESLEAGLTDETVSKASEQDLDQPEGADLGNPAKEKMSSAAPGPDKSKKTEDAAQKSFGETLPEEVQAKIDVSEFLKSLVDHTGEAIDGLKDYVSKSDASHEARYSEMTDTIAEVQKSQAKIGVVLKAICERIGVIENSPARSAKAETVVKSDKPAERAFSSGIAAQDGEPKDRLFKSLSDNPMKARSQISDALCELVKKSEAKDLDLIGFETNGYLSPEIVAKLKTVL